MAFFIPVPVVAKEEKPPLPELVLPAGIVYGSCDLSGLLEPVGVSFGSPELHHPHVALIGDGVGLYPNGQLVQVPWVRTHDDTPRRDHRRTCYIAVVVMTKTGRVVVGRFGVRSTSIVAFTEKIRKDSAGQPVTDMNIVRWLLKNRYGLAVTKVEDKHYALDLGINIDEPKDTIEIESNGSVFTTYVYQVDDAQAESFVKDYLHSTASSSEKFKEVHLVKANRITHKNECGIDHKCRDIIMEVSTQFEKDLLHDALLNIAGRK